LFHELLACGYQKVFGRPPEADDETLFVNTGKALAAFQQTLVTRRTPFDDFRDALARNDKITAAQYPVAAQRGLKIFVGKGACNVCHIGPNFSNGEFDKVGIPVRGPGGLYDWGATMASRVYWQTGLTCEADITMRRIATMQSAPGMSR